MKFNGQLLAALVGLCSVHAFNVGVPVSVRSQQTGVQRSRWVSMSDKAPVAAAAAAAPEKKRSIDVEFVQETPGGYITVLEVKNFKTITNHRIVMSKDELATYSGLAGRELDVSDFVKYIVKYMMDKGMKLDNTEGMIDSSVFPVNYFTFKQLSYFHDDVEEKITQICKDAPDLSEL